MSIVIINVHDIKNIKNTLIGGLNLKFYQNFDGTKIFATFVGDKPLWGELKLCGGSNIYYDTFII